MEKKKTPPAKERWDRENRVFVGLNLTKKNDKDILDAIEGKAKQTEIKRLVRLGLEAEKTKDQNQ